MKKLPYILLYSRIVAGLLFLALAYLQPANYRVWLVSLLVYAVLSDFFDGYTARALKVSTEKMRRADSTIDQFFWLCVIGGTVLTSFEFYEDYWLQITLILIAEALCYIISYIRFKKEVATHAIASKFWVVTLFTCFIDVIWNGNSTWVFQLCFWVGMVTRLEIVAILLILKQWTNDVPSVIHAVQLRKGKVIKRNKIFNG